VENSLPSGTQGTAYSKNLHAQDGTQPYTWSASGLPAGLSLGSSTGQITGTPSSSGLFSPQVTVTDNVGAHSTKTFSLNITGGSGGSLLASTDFTYLGAFRPPAHVPQLDSTHYGQGLTHRYKTVNGTPRLQFFGRTQSGLVYEMVYPGSLGGPNATSGQGPGGAAGSEPFATVATKWSTQGNTATTSAGSIYTGAALLDSGGQATATATATGGVVTGISVTGSDNLSGDPTVCLWDGSGSGFVGQAHLSPTTISSVELDYTGTNYPSSVTVTVTGGGGSGCTMSATMAPDGGGAYKIVAINVLTPGSGYTYTPTINISPESTDPATRFAILTPSPCVSVEIINGGSGYTSHPSILLVQGYSIGVPGIQGTNDWGLFWDSTTSRLYWSYSFWYNVSHPYDPSFGYSTLDDAGAPTNGGFGVPTGKSSWRLGNPTAQTGRFCKFGQSGVIPIPQAWADAHLSAGGVKQLAVGLGGYYSITSTASLGLALTAVASTLDPMKYPAGSVVPRTDLVGYPSGTESQRPPNYILRVPNSGQVASATITNQGSGYTTAPAVAFLNGHTYAPAATLTATVDGLGHISVVTVSPFPNHYYFDPPTVIVTGGGGTGGAVSVNTNGNVVEIVSANIDAPGTGYITAPTLTLDDVAKAHAIIDGAGHVTSLVIDAAGVNYDVFATTPVSVQFTGGGGSGAAATVTLTFSGMGAGTLDPSGGIGYWTWLDNPGGAWWFDLGTKRGVLVICSFCTGYPYYQGSTINATDGEIWALVYDPDDFIAVVNGSVLQSVPQPKAMWKWDLPPGIQNQLGIGSPSSTGADWSGTPTSRFPSGVTYDETTGVMYLIIENIWSDGGPNYYPMVFAYQVNP
jgi:hypothetical protein